MVLKDTSVYTTSPFFNIVTLQFNISAIDRQYTSYAMYKV